VPQVLINGIRVMLRTKLCGLGWYSIPKWVQKGTLMAPCEAN